MVANIAKNTKICLNILLTVSLSGEYSILAFSLTKMDCGILRFLAAQILAFDFVLCADVDCHRKENEAMKCETCEMMKRIEASNEPACCIWYMDNVVCGDKSVEDCTAYQSPKGE